jgi:creatinine amidohydrolase/Fe(II)-dependent formamide hydrolase-like protein
MRDVRFGTRIAVLAAGMIAMVGVGWSFAAAQETGKLSTQWEELTAADFVTAIHQAQGVCLLPFGILEKHGPHLPIGTDLINARWVALHGAAQEYAVVFPAYYFGQIDEARHEPGTIAYSRHMQLDLLQETTDEMARNGCKKILIVNGHGGNLSLLPYFAQTELQESHDYVVYVYWWDSREGPGRPKQQTTVDMHAGESETSHTLVTRPDLVHMDRGAGIGRGSGTTAFAGGCVHRHLVVRAVSESLFGGWIEGDAGAGRVRHEGVGRRSGGSDPCGEGR